MPDYLLVTADGAWTNVAFREMLDIARTAAAEFALTRILLDTRALSRPHTPYTRYLSGLYIADSMSRGFRIAAVGRPGNVTHHAETVARNRGFDIMAFIDRDQAIRWLLR